MKTLLTIAFIFLALFQELSAATPIENARIDLRDWDGQSRVKLLGEWKWYSGELLDSIKSEKFDQGKLRDFEKIIGPGNSHAGTYALRVENLINKKELGIHVYTLQYSAKILWVGDKGEIINFLNIGRPSLTSIW